MAGEAGFSAKTTATFGRRPALELPATAAARRELAGDKGVIGFTSIFTGSARGFEFRRIGRGALRHSHRRLEFRGMVFDTVACTPFAGTGGMVSVAEFRRAR